MFQRLSIIVGFIFICLTFPSQAQVPVTRARVKESVLELVQNYERRVSNVTQENKLASTRDLTTLFANGFVRVVNNLEENVVNPEIIIRSYCDNLVELYPEGVNVSIDFDQIRLGLIESDNGKNYTIPVHFELLLKAFRNGLVYENNQRVQMIVSFMWDGQSAIGFRIAGIEYEQDKFKSLTIHSSVGIGRVSAAWVNEASRFSMPNRIGYSQQLIYRQALTSRIGFGIGVGHSFYHSDLELDKLDPIDFRSPNFNTVHFHSCIYTIDLPLEIYYSQIITGRFSWSAALQFVPQYSYWKTMETKAMQGNYNTEVKNIISDSRWEDQLNPYSAGIGLSVGLDYSIGSYLSIGADLAGMTGIIAIDAIADTDFGSSKYQGQYNPLWMDPDGRNYLQFIGMSINLRYSLGNK